MQSVNLKISRNSILLFLFKLLLVVYVFVDFIRRFFESDKFILMSLDLVIIVTILFYLIAFKSLNISKISIFIRLYLVLFIFIVFFQILNPYYYDAITYIAGARSYLLAMPMIFIGYYFAKNKLLIRQSNVNFIIFFVVITLLYAIFQASTDYIQLYGTAFQFITPMEHGVHSHGDQEVQLVSSFFASSKRYGHFLIIMYLLYLGISLTLRYKISLTVTMLFVIALIISGARESFVLFFLIQIYLFFKFSTVKQKVIILTLSIVSMLIVMIVANDDLLLKIDFMLSTPDEYLRRVYMFFPPALVDFNHPNMFFGLGVGKYGQEAILNSEVLSLTYGIDREFFHSLDFFGSSYGFMDAGLAKIFIELGFLGIVVYLLFLGSALYLASGNLLLKFYDDYLKMTLSFFIILWVVYMMKAHPNISDIFMSYFLFFSIGYVSYKNQMKVKHENN